jgi:hypothetical protein
MQPADGLLIGCVKDLQLVILGLLMIIAHRTYIRNNIGQSIMGAYDDMLSDSVIERTLDYNGKSKKVYFKQLTAGQRINMSRGQKFAVNARSREEGVQVDMGDTMERGHKFLLYCHVTAEGKQVFNGLKEIQDLPEDLIAKLQDLADDALGMKKPVVEAEAPAENPSSETNS